MVYDPFGLFGNDPAPLAPTMRRPQPIKPFSPEEEESVLGRVTSGALGGLSFAGSVLDKTFGGRAVRGLLGGRPEEALSIIPGSDWMTLTDERNAVSGNELAKQWGLIGEGTKGQFELQDLVGPALEIGLDPGTYLTFGGSALSKGGQVAKKLGLTLPKGGAARAAGTLGGLLDNLPGASFLRSGMHGPLPAEAMETAAKFGRAEQLAGGKQALSALEKAPLGGHFGVGLPFMDPLMTFDASPVLDPLAKYAGKAWNKIPGSGTVNSLADWTARQGRALFGKDYMGATTNEFQGATSAASEAMRKALEQDRVQLTRLARRLAEGGEYTPARLADLRALREGGQLSSPVTPLFQSVADELYPLMEKYGRTENELGSGISVLDNYFPRQKTAHEGVELGKQAGKARAAQAASTFHKSQIGRDELFDGLTTGRINELARDANVSGAAGRSSGLLPETEYIRRNYLGMAPADDARLFRLRNATGPLSPQDAADLARLSKLWDQAPDLARWAAGLDPKYATGAGLDFFGNDPFFDVLTRAERHHKFKANADAVYNTLAKYAGAAPGPESTSVEEVLKGVFGDPAMAGLQFQQRAGGKVAGQSFLPKHIADDILKHHKPFQLPSVLEPVAGVVDSLTNLTKAWQTAPFPNFHVRNLLSSMMSGQTTGANTARGLQDAWKVLGGGTLEGAAQLPPFAGKGLTDEQATKALADLAFGHNALSGFARTDVPGSTLPGKFLEQIPGEVKYEGMWQNLKEAFPTSKAELAPWNVAGVGGRLEDTNSLVRAGRKFGKQTEDATRLGTFLELVKKGTDPSVAGQMVRDAMVDYGNLSGFERNVMSRLIPYYAYARGNLPYVARNVAQRPGGLNATTAKLANSINRDDNGFIPERLDDLAVPVSEMDGKTNYLTSLGLPAESAFQQIHTGPGGLQRTLLDILGQANPLIKAPIELATGKQLFSGRELDDLSSGSQRLLGVRSPVLDELFANSPAQRPASYLGGLFDSDKGVAERALNALTGLRVASIDTGKEKDRAARDVIEDRLRGREGVRMLETLAIDPAAVASMPPELQALARLKITLDKRAREEAKKKKGGK